MFPQRPDSTLEQNTYIAGDSEAELIRLVQQSEIFTKIEGGILPERENLLGINKILDAASGPGEWAIQVATLYPNIQVIGVDINKRMIDYARMHAQRLENVRFLIMDVTKPLDFPDETFDIVNARFVQGVLTTDSWPSFIKECIRILRPGGSIRLTEAVLTDSTSHDFNHLMKLLNLALAQAKRSFSPDGNTYGLSPMLGAFLRAAGCQLVSYRPFVVDYSGDTGYHEVLAQHICLTFAPDMGVAAFFYQIGIISPEDYQQIYDKAMVDLFSPKFRGLGHILTTVGEKSE